jgi:hypothetical protein
MGHLSDVVDWLLSRGVRVLLNSVFTRVAQDTTRHDPAHAAAPPPAMQQAALLWQ